MSKALWCFLADDETTAVEAAVIDDAGSFVRKADVTSLAEEAYERCIAVIAGTQVALLSLELPDGTPVQLAAAAKLMAADCVASIGDTAMVAVAPASDADGTRLTAHFQPSVCQGVLARLSALGLDPDVILPAAALLQKPQEGSIRAPYMTIEVARTSTRAFAAEAIVMDLILEEETPQETMDAAAFDHCIRTAASKDSQLNLRVDAFAKKSEADFSLRWLKRSAILLALALVLWPVAPIVKSVKYNAAAREVDAQVMEDVRSALPNAPRIVNARAQLDERIAALGLSGGPEQLAAKLTQAIQSQPGTTAESLRYDPARGLNATLVVADQNRVDQLVKALEQAGLRVQAQPIRTTRDGPRAEFLIQAAR